MTKNSLTTKFVIVIASLLFTFSLNAQDIERGKKVFSEKCVACHNVDMKTKLLGPGLGGINERWKGKEDLLIKWIKDPNSVLESGDAYAKKMFEENNKIPMPPNPDLSDDVIKDMIAYINQVAGGSPGNTSTTKESETKEPEKEAVVAETVIAATSSSASDGAIDLQNGKEVFKNYCAACHAKDMKTRMVGPGLAGIDERWKGKEALLVDWIKDSKKVIDSGDEYAKKVFEEYSNIPMPANPSLKDNEINNVIAYINAVSDGSFGAKKASGAAVGGGDTAALDNGKKLYKDNCAACHSKDMKAKMTGPALGGVQERWSGKEDLLKKWIKNSTAVIESGDEYAVSLFNEYNKIPMTAFPNLKTGEIDDILAYIDGVTNGTYGVKKVETVAGTDGEEQAGTSNWMYLGLLALLSIFSIILFMVNGKLRQSVDVKEGREPSPFSLMDIFTGKNFVGLVVLIATILGGYFTIVGAVNIGRQQGYQPDQPIKFSHKTHAGVQKIDCEFCHDGARRSKHSVIPAANTCMNCHAAIQTGSTYGTAELTKIYASIGFNPNNGEYIKDYENMDMEDVAEVYKKWIALNNDNDKTIVKKQWKHIKASLTTDVKKHVGGPIPWTRVHNLPDHVYYNHSQHVTVGKLECQTCHGKVEEMDVVEQHSPLSMGWCINCHRQTDVQFSGNEYYESYEKLHEELKSGDRSSVKVADIGGLECSKCHY